MECSCCDPVWSGVKGEVEDEAEDVVRLLVSRLVEFSTEEKVEAKGDADVVVLMEGLLDEPGRRANGSMAEDETFVDSGVRPRREPVL